MLNLRIDNLKKVIVIIQVVTILTLGFAMSTMAERTNIRVSSMKALGNTVLYGMISRKMLEAEGLNVDFYHFPSGLEQIEALISNKVDFALTSAGPAVVILAKENAPVKIVAAYMTGGDELAIVTREDLWTKGEVKSIKDLRGRKIATGIGSISHYHLAASLKANGLDIKKDIKLLDMSPPDWVTGIRGKEVDAVACWEPWITHLEKMGIAKVLERAGKYTHCIGTVLVHESLLNKDPDAVVDFLVALRKSADYCNANRVESAKFTEKWIKLPPDVLESSLQWVNFKSSWANDYYADLANMATLMHEIGKIKRIPDFKKHVDLRYLDKANEKLRRQGYLK
jgi:ABC-type nitrate/sulfonate/bicarbonate transport system substrate-binding protein